MKLLKIILPILVLLAGIAGAVALVGAREKPAVREPEVVVPLVRVRNVELSSIQLTVTSQGTVRPRTESVLIPEISGQIIEISPNFVSGGFFESGEVLLRLEAHDYEQALVRTQAEVAQAKMQLELELAEAELAQKEWQEIGEGDASPLTLRKPQVERARAVVAAATAAHRKAQRDLERTVIHAPYAGRVREKRVDVGQFVSRGGPLGTIYSIDYAEIRLPLPDSELAFLDLPLVYRGDEPRGAGPAVTLRADFAGRRFEWTGRIVRTEGEIDLRSRMVHTVAQVKDPYSRGNDPDRPPLAAGLWVEAEILGHRVSHVTRLPRSALREGNRVLVVDGDNRLHFREVEIVREQGDEVIVGAGLAEGEQVVVSTLLAATDGMLVQTEPESPENGAAG